MSGHPDILDLWLDGRLAGSLMRGPTDEVEFSYDAEYFNSRGVTPLSVSMPLVQQHYGPNEVMPWLSNLLPDAVEVRDRWAAKFGETRNDPFTLLRHMGQDAPGSVQVVPWGAQPSQLGSMSHITDARIAERIHEIIEDPDHWVDDGDEDQSRFSLGGNQGKFALAKLDGQWFEPNGRTASTHIVKPGMVTAQGHTNAEVQAIEFVSMRAARYLGLTTALVEIENFNGLPAFVTQRYDRRIDQNGTVTRLHQEDFCQALTFFPSRKYEEDGGPTMADMVAVVDKHGSPRWRERDRLALARLFAFNLLTAGVDAHAKNHSLILSGSLVRLAPAYDLISAHGMWNKDRVRFKGSAAVRYGKVRPYRQITGRNLARTADTLRMGRREFHDQLVDMQRRLPSALDKAVNELPEEMLTERVKRMPEREKDFGTDVTSRMTMGDIEDTPKFDPPANRSHRRRSRVWAPGQLKDGVWESGTYRNRGHSR
ncbi:type II toxin-antitoxin system HipA family toxin [Corynebacterium testudinoris]|uniref:HipA domain-containing protein n=1 Tax=Corynebacterium testudinoris TaxID=136857 RepID=UPI001C8C943C|nr:HipA domain-containing protein [Corynebacterium testudinoris]MBX8996910.1 type II toxin-antitoxin system HipA family toxin [Corynebacterium testudinoris]